ncbi:hypothetical protein MRX96_021748 [Rhipicephalus microplus]
MVVAGSPVYLLTFGGLLKMVQIGCAIPALVLVTSLSFNHETGEFEMEHTDMYRMNYAIGTLALAVNTGLFYVRFASARSTSAAPGTTEHGPKPTPPNNEIIATVESEDMSIPFYLCIANTVAYGVNYFYAIMMPAPPAMGDTLT